ncbi:MAG TPA: hypothetical protein VGC58_02680 [Candidatus Paceibacterota bacterium]
MKRANYYIIITILVLTIPSLTFAAAWWDFPGQLIETLLGIFIEAALTLMSFVLWLSGYLLNFVLKYTLVDMKTRLVGLDGINTAWKVMRDLMNIAFIFLLIYEAIKLIIGQSTTQQIGKFVGMIVLSALLINFSLFFTKVLIDGSNIVTVGFYNIIRGEHGAEKDYGLSNPIAKALGLPTVYDPNQAPPDFNARKGVGAMLIMGLGSALLILVAAFVFFAITVLFIVRYITLLILLMLSPVAYMGMSLPFMKSYSNQWWDALKSQLIFPPVFMLMIWLVLTLMSSDGFINQAGNAKSVSAVFNTDVKPDFEMMGLALNFVVIIGLLIGSLIVAKQTSTKGSKLIGQATGNLTAFAGGVVMGGSAWAGRRSFGLGGKTLADNAALQEMANKKTYNGIADRTRSAGARLALYASKQARDATFDVRNASAPTNVIGDLARGTVGRTTLGKKMGLNDLNIPSVAVGAPLSGLAGTGRGGTKGYVEEKKESEKRVRDRETTDSTELSIAKAKKDILSGITAAPGTTQYDAMEKEMAKLSDKQTETLVSSNRQLLKSLNFANMISVKQLEALNKSDQLSDSEKDLLKNTRFSGINTAMKTGTAASIATARNDIRNLSDSEIEMLDTAYLANPDFVSHLKSGQMESINKSSRFTTSQKGTLRNSRRAPLNNALTTGDAALVAGNIPAFDTEVINAKAVVKGLGHKEVAALDMAVLTSPTMLKVYNPQMLKRMADEMSPSDIPTLRTAIQTGGDMATIAWLATPDSAKFS